MLLSRSMEKQTDHDGKTDLLLMLLIDSRNLAQLT